MTTLYVVAFLLFTVGAVFVLNLTPDQINKDVSVLIDHRQSLRDKTLTARGQKKQNRLLAELEKTKRALTESGKEKQFSIACALSLILVVVGCVVAIVLDNPFLVPVLAVAFAMIPFVYLKRTISIYETHVKEEIETALSIITTSYVRIDNIVLAVQENTQYLKPPVKGIFESFVAETTVISPDIRQAIRNLKDKVQNSIFEEWCDILISCQSDRTLKDTLMPTVAKFTDVRMVNNSLKTMLAEIRREYYIMVAMVLGNIPLLYALNKEWFNALVFTLFGKIVLTICGAVILITALLLGKYTQPVEYKR